MKKHFVLFLSFLVGMSTWGTGQFGVEFSPGISHSRVFFIKSTPPSFYSTGGEGAIRIGGTYDLPIKAYCDMSTGLFFATRGVGVKSSNFSSKLVEEQFSVFYLECPILLKLYTTEVELDTNIYFKIGFVPAIRLLDREKKRAQSQADRFIIMRRMQLSGLVGVGIKYDFSLSTSLCIGLSYHHDIFGIVSQTYEVGKKKRNLAIHNNFIGLNLGVHF